MNRNSVLLIGNITKAILLMGIVLWLAACSSQSRYNMDEGTSIAIIGNSLADRMQHDGWLETYIHAIYPDHRLTIRNLGFTGDQIHHRPRAHEEFGSPDQHLINVEADVIFAFFGYNESFDNDPETFQKQLREWIAHTKNQQYNGESAPDIILFSPIAHENLNSPDLPDGIENNRRLEAYSHAMHQVAQETGVLFVNLFEPSLKWYEGANEPLTINGVHLSDEGNRKIADSIVKDLFGGLPWFLTRKIDELRKSVLDKNWHWFNRYRATSGNDVWGGRAELHGNRETLQHELKMLEVMTTNRDKAIWAVAQGKDITVDDSNVPAALPVETNYKGEANYISAEKGLGKLTLAEGLKANVFASEEMFPELVNPVQMQVDTKGRVWVAAWTTYPKWEPMKEMSDKLLILEDTNGDGVADESTVFANIHNPTGFEFWNEGVIVVSAPDILYLEDTNGDNKADKIVRLMGAIDSADTHHTANNITYGPDGWIYYQRGVFHLNNVETPWGPPMESETSGLYRFNPRTYQFEFIVENIYNPHGISFDQWGYQFITDGTMGTAHQVYLDLEENSFKKRPLLEHTVRPVPGNQVFSSSHFPNEFQNNLLIYNVIGFLGAKRYELSYNNGEVWGEEIGDLFYSEDPNFRPSAGVVGSDGALYVSDWHNVIIGHMQHNLRDPMRDHKHGRIYRITANDRPLTEPVQIYGEPIMDLLELFKHPDNGIRHRVRIELSGKDTDDLLPVVDEWVKLLDASREQDALPLLEALWVYQQHNRPNMELLGKLLNSPVENARIAAQRVMWHWNENHSKTISVNETQELETITEDEVQRDLELDFTPDDRAVFTIKALVSEMRFDVIYFKVRGGQPVELTFENPDYMPHNLLITERGAVDDVYEMAQNMGGSGFEKQFVPDTPLILQATDLLQRNEIQILEFSAPDEEGRYHFVCSFPGHGELMRGIMEVVNE